MNEELLNDLKQFIAATVTQATSDLVQRFDGLEDRFDNLEGRFNQLEQRMDERFDELDTKLTTIADAHAEAIEDHETRIGRLETGAA